MQQQNVTTKHNNKTQQQNVTIKHNNNNNKKHDKQTKQ